MRYHTQQAKSYATELRRNMTAEERRLWYCFLRSYRPRFHRQMAIGTYIADFVCPSCRLIVELDGGQHYEAAGLEHDAARTAFLQSQGYRVVRFINSDVQRHFSSVCQAIDRAVHDERYLPSPS